VAIYRSYYWNGDHFMSPIQSEGPNAGYTDEGVVFYLYAAPCQWGLLPFYRLLNPNTGEHFYTASQAENDSLVGVGWWAETPLGCIDPQNECGNVPLYRLAASMHIFTTSDAERDAYVSQGWYLEGPAGYVWTSP
jgi:hypothetical protein